MGADYRLYVDDTVFSVPDPRSNKRLYSGLVGCVMTRHNAQNLRSLFEEIKCKYFARFHQPGMPVILHRRKMLDRAGPFIDLKNDSTQSDFLQDLERAIRGCEFTVIAGIAPAAKYPRKGWRVRAKRDALEFIVTRYCGILYNANHKGDVVLEGTDREEDRRLRDMLEHLLDYGSPGLRPPAYFKSALSHKPFFSALRIKTLLAYSWLIC